MKKLTKDIIGTHMQILEVWRLTLISNNINVAFYYQDEGRQIVIIVKSKIGDVFPGSETGIKYEIPLFSSEITMMIGKYIEQVIMEMVRKLIVKNFDIINGRIGGFK
jgi:hypothetical protein